MLINIALLNHDTWSDLSLFMSSLFVDVFYAILLTVHLTSMTCPSATRQIAIKYHVYFHRLLRSLRGYNGISTEKGIPPIFILFNQKRPSVLVRERAGGIFQLPYSSFITYTRVISPLLFASVKHSGLFLYKCWVFTWWPLISTTSLVFYELSSSENCTACERFYILRPVEYRYHELLLTFHFSTIITYFVHNCFKFGIQCVVFLSIRCYEYGNIYASRFSITVFLNDLGPRSERWSINSICFK